MPEKHVGLFFTRDVSLEAWEQGGMLAREVSLYERLVDRGWKVTFVTYGGRADLEIGRQLDGIDVVCNSSGMPRALYRRLLIRLHSKALARCSVFKSNQTLGADRAAAAGARFGRPFVARSGYRWSEFSRHLRGDAAGEKALRYEQRVFSAAHRIVVSTAAAGHQVSSRWPRLASRVTIIPNFVDTELFSPDNSVEPDRDVVYVGRLSEQKNVESLIQAADIGGFGVRIIGDGNLREACELQARTLGCDVEFAGRLPHTLLPSQLRLGRIFVLPSHYEGHPKTLLEAMACGCAVVGTRVPGIREVIRPGETGLLCGTEPTEIADAVTRLLNDGSLRSQLGGAARRAIVNDLSLTRIVEQEENVLLELSAEHLEETRR
ncbi:glycosyltransferase family 4 protein [Stratiformator vulcanicus]|uniref:GalNAc-alpha-(1->4)-GalNAc-alpha-(1->3)-diNAcBac-PP-undecaprenol alpha-1,4-N-acetyl-D-galactosaminyltransferase n=1 Tax=Stratiformator vulcanicus TaxID=2527980 RepID=A0A517QVW4_9PLAN|nr:glycosyltransferase family 4 protein [Stratiformator vulcanicus]QDT35771.1 GalNAc-alpha-(1->4)-GalNAc-alpha-(1->3)-diNAcBac-PP-undecaprenol alpha-1,4-N-acetyl-D-galactosaminyltransferase [Stratiformator vulcanicus]